MVDFDIELNNNMRCFEMLKQANTGEHVFLLNNNMRCFEMVEHAKIDLWERVKQ